MNLQMMSVEVVAEMVLMAVALAAAANLARKRWKQDFTPARVRVPARQTPPKAGL